MKVYESKKVIEVLEGAVKAAIAYYELTGKPLGITGELAECYAAQLLDLELVVARTPGYDALDNQGRRIQIKARRITRDKANSSQRVGSIRLNHDWDVVMLVLLDENFNAFAIYEADRLRIKEEIERPGSKARNERGALPVSTIKRIGKKVWSSK